MRNNITCVNDLYDKLNRVVVDEAYDSLICAIVERAVDDYKECIKIKAIYDVETIRVSGVSFTTSCVDIIRELKNNPLIYQYYNDGVLEYVFKEVDKKYGYWFNRMYGSDWVHPWDFV